MGARFFDGRHLLSTVTVPSVSTPRREVSSTCHGSTRPACHPQRIEIRSPIGVQIVSIATPTSYSPLVAFREHFTGGDRHFCPSGLAIKLESVGHRPTESTVQFSESLSILIWRVCCDGFDRTLAIAGLAHSVQHRNSTPTLADSPWTIARGDGTHMTAAMPGSRGIRSVLLRLLSSA